MSIELKDGSDGWQTFEALYLKDLSDESGQRDPTLTLKTFLTISPLDVALSLTKKYLIFYKAEASFQSSLV